MRSTILVFVITYLVDLTSQTQSSCWNVLNHKNCNQLPDDDVCGTVSPTPFVLGGHDAARGQFPWMAMLFFRKFLSRDQDFGCGGSIISSKLVISAAHCCVKERFGRKLTMVRVGEHDLSSSNNCKLGSECSTRVQDIRVDDCIVHEGYNPRTFQNDISIVFLKKPIKYTVYVSPICLPISEWFLESDLQNHTLEVAGWGISNNSNPKRSEILQTLSVELVQRPICQEAYSFLRISGIHLCAGGEEGKDSCQGDSGGPLMGQFIVDIPRSRYFLIGVVSYGSQPCGITLPGVYVNVVRYISWILDNMNN